MAYALQGDGLGAVASGGAGGNTQAFSQPSVDVLRRFVFGTSVSPSDFRLRDNDGNSVNAKPVLDSLVNRGILEVVGGQYYLTPTGLSSLSNLGFRLV